MPPPATRHPFIGGLPQHGIWTALGLGRGQFFAIHAAAALAFVFVGGPVWTHLHDAHFLRITVSYGVIPPAVWAALRRNGSGGAVAVLVASAVLACIKLVLTAALLVVVALARS